MSLAPFFNARYRGIFLLLLVSILTTNSMQGQVTFFYNETAYQLPNGALSFYVDSSQNHNWDRFISIKNKLKPYPEHKFSLSYQNKMVWLKFNFEKVSQPSKRQFLMVRNPHINYLQAWLLKDDSLVQSFPLTGDHQPFDTRPVYFSDFLFPLPEDSLPHYSIVLMIDKRNEVINIPLHLLSDEALLQYVRVKNWTAGLFIGISFFLFLFNFFLFINMRERLYIFYGLYIFLGFFYIFSDFGFTFMYLFPNVPALSDFTRPISILLATPVYLFFCLELLETKKHLPRHYKWMCRTLWAYLALLIAGIFMMGQTGEIRAILSGVSYLFLNVLMTGNVIIGIDSFRKKVPFALYIVFAAIILMATLFLFSLYLSGHLADTYINRNLMKIAISSEIAILTLVLSFRFKRYKMQSEQLLRKVTEQQKHIFSSITDYKENELQRLSSLLHDSIGARLSALRFNLESGVNGTGQEEKIRTAISEIHSLADDIRRFSHNLSPVLLQKKGLKGAIEDFITPINKSGKLQVQFEMIGSTQRSSFRYELLIYNIIQELIQNILKHAHASESIIQLILEKDLVSLYVEDNGRGFDPEENNSGLGFSQIKKLVIFVNGTFRIDSSETRGTRVSIEFTALPDEKYDPDTHS